MSGNTRLRLEWVGEEEVGEEGGGGEGGGEGNRKQP